MKVKIVNPQLLVIEARQERDDTDYGQCLWLRCTLNLEANSINIESDCGNFSYSGFCTADFLKFCGELGRDHDYLLRKMSSKTVVDDMATLGNIYELFSDCLQGDLVSDDAGDAADTFWEEIKDAISCYDTARDIVDSVLEVLSDHDMSLDCDYYDLYECISFDYPAHARKAIEIFCEHIVPVIADEAKKVADHA